MDSSRVAEDADRRGLDVAAVDLGSNSFHMIVARANGSDLQVLDRMREPVRLAEGLDDRRRLCDAVAERALACLQRFGERLKHLPPSRVRAVGTNTLRRMRGGHGFRAAAEAALGHPIEIISGIEEARLVYGAVVHGLADVPRRRLVVDIGGGSTELIIGEGPEPQLMESVSLGCVVHTAQFFADGSISRKAFAAARLAARVELEYLERSYRRAGWDLAVGTSGTIRGIWRVVAGQGWCGNEITREALEKLIERVLDLGQVRKIRFEELREDRRPVFVGGLAVLAGVFDALRLERMETSDQALREGLIHDLLGRLSNRDVRDQAVRAMSERYSLDATQAEVVRRTALALLQQCAADWGLDAEECGHWLGWAAALHEVGLAISHSSYHKHGEYILRHADLPGFSRTEQHWVAALVRLHRRKFAAEALESLEPEDRDWVRRLAVLLRLAFLLNRSRNEQPPPTPRIQVRGNAIWLRFADDWLAQHPLTAGDLEHEVKLLRRAGFQLDFR